MFFPHGPVCAGALRRWRTPSAALLVIWIFLASSLWAATPSTQPTQPAPPTTAPGAPADPRLVARWFGELASSDPAVRDAARNRLVRLDRADLPRLQQLVRAAQPLAPSQLAALKPIVQEIYLAGEPYKQNTMMGFLGILMDESALAARDLQQPNDTGQTPGVVVADRFPGFCASRSLHDGDVILGTTNPAQAFNSSTDLKTAITGLEPGTIVHLQVLRHGQVVDVPLTLDCKPADVDSTDTAESFRRERAEKFDQYWREAFAPLLKESVG